MSSQLLPSTQEFFFRYQLQQTLYYSLFNFIYLLLPSPKKMLGRPLKRKSKINATAGLGLSAGSRHSSFRRTHNFSNHCYISNFEMGEKDQGSSFEGKFPKNPQTWLSCPRHNLLKPFHFFLISLIIRTIMIKEAQQCNQKHVKVPLKKGTH